jgi:mannose-1-phosphate guanylyltransferase / mannose-6-phosphate isomerase
MNLIPTILCGGAGSRLWPVSRETHPKPFMQLQDGESLLQKAFLRAANLVDTSEILTVTNRDLFFKTEDAYREVNTSHLTTSFILEPFGRNTAAAIAAAVLQIEKTHGADAILLVLAADHLISDQPAFQAAVKTACVLAQSGKLVTFGIEPDSPETGFGYIEADGNKVIRFVEKPNLAKAKEYLASGRFYWNSGMFCFTAGTMLAAMKLLCPEILNATRVCIEVSRNAKSDGLGQLALDPKLFDLVPEDSIDFAVMEKADNLAVVPCKIGWSDIGSWSAMSDVAKPDENGNRILGDALLHDVTNCYIQSHDRIVGAVGVDDLIIVDTADAVLVARKSMAQNVKHLYAELKANNHDAHKHHRTVQRPWGDYTVLDEGPGYKIKHITVKPGASLSLQMHHYRSEHWVVVSGVASVTKGEENYLVNTNESTFIPVGTKHRLQNATAEALTIIEVQSGSYVGEDDIVRFQDIYGRA